MKKFNQKKEQKKWKEEYSDIDDQIVKDIQLLSSDDEKQEINQNQKKDVDEIEIIEEKSQINQEKQDSISENKSNNKNDEKKENKIEWLDSDIEDFNNLDDEEEQDLNEQELQIDHDKQTIFVQNLPLKVKDSEIEAFFQEYGNVLSIEVPRNEGSTLNKGKAFIEFSSIEQAIRISKLKLEFYDKILKMSIGLQQIKKENKQQQQEYSDNSRSRSQSK